ncbi:hypothetical protein [Nocardia niwae]|uniref:Uncharacterized protein n=1 Tax=Nocardia niwae TaxID=626084 RepID=A0ABV2X3Z8_9NOCA|nr:hypothetical protein [Nocardia niwae]
MRRLSLGGASVGDADDGSSSASDVRIGMPEAVTHGVTLAGARRDRRR